jgi:hypothetical protein
VSLFAVGIDGNEIDAAFHEPGDEVDVARQTVELGFGGAFLLSLLLP